MVVSVAAITARKGHEADVVKVLNDFVTGEKKLPGVVKVYFKKAVDNDDTFLVYTEYESRKHFEEAEKAVQKGPEGGSKVEFILRPHILKAFYGNFE